MNNTVIFCDFDGTITKNDTIDELLNIHANKNWLKIEESWKKGEIGSKECLTKQLECIDYISENQLDNFIENIEIDDYFINFIEILNKKKTKLYIVSDGFDLFIENVLEKYGLNHFIKVFSNKLIYKNGKLIPEFPLHNTDCKKKAGLCKCEVIKKLKKENRILYIGDGASDICASRLANLLFAKDSLAKYCDKNNINHIKFKTFKNICEYLYINLEEETDVKNKILIRQRY